MAKQLTLGVLAHVDAGKTTLCEGLLFHNKVISSFGRVDKGESFLDYVPLERKRGITIYSKQAIMTEPSGSAQITLLDTPGHVDFVWETLACMEVMDAALLVVDASSQLSAHSIRLFKLLKQNNIPVFVFMNKMDLAHSSRSEILESIAPFGTVAVDFTADTEEIWENAALCDEELLNDYLEKGSLTDEQIQKAIAVCKLTPVFFGVAQAGEGVSAVSDGLFKYLTNRTLKGRDFLPFKTEFDDKGARLIHGRLLGSECLKVKDTVFGEKVEEIRLYNGAKYEALKEAQPGMLVALRGPVEITPVITGDGAYLPLVEYEMVLPEGSDPIPVMQKLSPLVIEQPALNLRMDTENSRILLSPMGDIQLEILKDMLNDRFGVEADFLKAGVIYKETIGSIVEGVGHFEPLRHYSECHLILEPNPGKGIEVRSVLDTDSLAGNWQSQILSALKNADLRGTLTGAGLTDVRFTLVAGRSHEKHTEGGDFREAALRAYRQGLMKAGCRLLEPLYAFELRISSEGLGKVLTRLETMGANWEPPEFAGNDAVLAGSFPVTELGDFPVFVTSASAGAANLSLGFGGYIPCRNEDEVLATHPYDPEADLSHPADSVFTSHGSSVIVPWFEVENYMHLPPAIKFVREEKEDLTPINASSVSSERFIGLEEIESIIGAAGGANRRKSNSDRRSHWNRYSRADALAALDEREGRSGEKASKARASKRELSLGGPVENYLLVDGYNIIFAWEYLSELSKDNIDSAKDLLVDILSEYAAYTGVIVILVFDAYKVAGGVGSVLKDRGIHIIHTKEAQTADAYIEKTSHELAKKHNVRVASSDRLEQMIVWGEGALPMSARDLFEEIKRIKKEIEEHYI